MAVPVRATVDEAKRTPIPPSPRSAELMRHATWVVFYGPNGGEDDV